MPTPSRPPRSFRASRAGGADDAAQLDNQTTLELPARHALTLIDPSMADGLISYANASQTAPTTQGGATSSPLFGQGLATLGSAAQGAQSAPNGATVQNLNSPNSSGIATTNPG